MQVIENIFSKDISKELKRPELTTDFLESTIKNILQRVKTSGDEALLSLTEQFDKVKLSSLKLSDIEIQNAEQQISPELKRAIGVAKENIEKFHSAQKRSTAVIETTTGVSCWRKSVAIEKVGLYIPGGSAPLFSTVLMLGIPAKIAGCKQVVLCTPPDKSGKIDPAIIYTASLVGVTDIYTVGGAQAIAAMAYGTETIPKVNKIFGPGNQYVTKAKQMINLEGVAIDMPAGPSEVAIIADETANPAFIAADLLSQAEHGADSQVVLITNSKELIQNVFEAIEKQVAELPRKEIAKECLSQSKAVLVNDIDEAIKVSNSYAPEHLIINCSGAEAVAEKITQAGSVFIGEYTPESAGDYASGTNHTLPTNGAASAYSGVSLDSFVKEITFQKITGSGLLNLGPTVEIMAEAEQLVAHKNAVSIRLNELQQ
ncbi:histidinol dehydrogenase [Fulvivirga lutimaris]|uniref:histidinol dehydrogenase n=1 Tax=Fulvivirga lutimaris TaxID=1819566 RepID=UPI0012BCDF11|nr:histidinol dehydrogenase [Fulvivirga lutimaris]MTI41573.1 histidinol dehydrogenase [Fulvivirga lutimaris]